MRDYAVQKSPKTYARICGILYLIIIVVGFCGEFFVRDRIVVSDVSITAKNIAASEWLWRAQIAGDLLLLVCAVALTLILYVLFRPVNKDLALLAVLFNLVEFPIEAVSKLCLFAALFLSGNSSSTLSWKSLLSCTITALPSIWCFSAVPAWSMDICSLSRVISQRLLVS